MVIAFGVISTFIAIFGMEGRGEWSRGISTVGGLLWLAAVIWGFIYYGTVGGILYLLGTFVLGAILRLILRPLVNPHGH